MENRRIDFINIKIDNLSMCEAIENVNSIIKNNEKIYIVTPNVDHIVKLQNNDDFLKAYNSAGLVLVDGTPLMWAAKKFKTPLKEKITGPEFTKEVIKLSSKENYSIFFLGGKDGVAKKCAENMQIQYPGFKIAGYYSPKFGFEKDQDEIERIINVLNNSKANVVIAGMGSPKTEIFIYQVIDKLDINICMSVGAAIDFYAETVKRCPKWINKIGLEWFYRFLKEPRRMFKRYFVDDPKFLPLVRKYIKEKKRNEHVSRSNKA